MGKTGKKRKRQKLAAELQLAAKRQRLQESIARAAPTKPQVGTVLASVEAQYGGLPPEDVAATLRTLRALKASPELLKSREMKPLRAALHPLAAHLGIAKRLGPGNYASAVTAALEDGRWADAVAGLRHMKQAKSSLALGALQRWVHMCALDTIHAYDPTALLVLDAIIRVSSFGDALPDTGVPPPVSAGGSLIKHTPWAPMERTLGEDGGAREAAAVATQWREKKDAGKEVAGEEGSGKRLAYEAACRSDGRFAVVAHEKAAERRPPNKFDLHIYASTPGVISFGPDLPVEMKDVPGVPGAFAMTKVLSRDECLQFVAAAEAVGYVPDEPLTRGQGGASRAATFAWLADETILEAILRRCRPHLPPALGGGELAGLNARFRLYRYTAGNVYGPHIDGAWPGSGAEDGRYQYDAFGDRWSKLTFLLYLNDDFEGGGTTYFTADPRPGVLEAHAVAPRAGCVVCFPHGDARGALVHEGSLVTSGFKYIVRTDVLYMLPEDAGKKSKLFARHIRTNQLQDEQRAVES